MSIKLLLLLTLATAYAAASGKLKFEEMAHTTTIEEGTRVGSWTCTFSNNSDESIKVNSVETTCGCTVAKLEKIIYKPHETGKLQIEMSVGQSGIYTHDIHINTDEPFAYVLHMTTTVGSPITLSPRLFIWKTGDTTPKQLTIALDDKILAKPVALKETPEGIFQIRLATTSDKNKYVFYISPSAGIKADKCRLDLVFDHALPSKYSNLFVYGVIR